MVVKQPPRQHTDKNKTCQWHVTFLLKDGHTYCEAPGFLCTTRESKRTGAGPQRFYWQESQRGVGGLVCCAGPPAAADRSRGSFFRGSKRVLLPEASRAWRLNYASSSRGGMVRGWREGEEVTLRWCPDRARNLTSPPPHPPPTAQPMFTL